MGLNHKPSVDDLGYDLKPPPPRQKQNKSLDSLSELLMSKEHFSTILQDQQLFRRFTSFLSKYRSKTAPLLLQYIETQKALKAIEYANAVAEGVAPITNDKSKKAGLTAARLDPEFEEKNKKAFESLTDEAFPAYISYDLVKSASEIMRNEIMGKSTPFMRELVQGLSEVFCLVDPKQEDSPIIYASDEFYRMTGYHRDYVIGSNCRFLQGPKTNRPCVKRLRDAQNTKQDTTEILLNYRRDGSPFMNLLMIAPLLDDKDNVKYYIGAQIDVTGLVEGGRGIDSFERCIAQQQVREQARGRKQGSNLEGKKKALEKLGELSEMFDMEESAIVASHSRSTSMTRFSDDEGSTRSTRNGGGRRVLADEDRSDDNDRDTQIRASGLSHHLAHLANYRVSTKAISSSAHTHRCVSSLHPQNCASLATSCKVAFWHISQHLRQRSMA